MSSANFPQIGDVAVDLRHSGKVGSQDRCGETVTVKRITQTMVITSNGEKYNRERLHPIHEGQYSDRELVPANDPRVLIIKGRQHLTTLADVARNLAEYDHRTPDDIVTALTQLVRAAMDSRTAVLGLIGEASRSEQASNR